MITNCYIIYAIALRSHCSNFLKLRCIHHHNDAPCRFPHDYVFALLKQSARFI